MYLKRERVLFNANRARVQAARLTAKDRGISLFYHVCNIYIKVLGLALVSQASGSFISYCFCPN